MLNEQKYLDLLKMIVSHGEMKTDRTGTGTLSVFGTQTRYDLRQGFPLWTTKKVHFKSILVELLWFLNGDTNIKFLQDNGVTIWNEWADKNGDLGEGVYGEMWRAFPSIDKEGCKLTCDQISKVIKQLKENPDSRRLVVSAWNPCLVDEAALPPCHSFFQFNTSKIPHWQRVAMWEEKTGGSMDDFEGEDVRISVMNASGIPTMYLDCQLYQRSADMFLGVPFNVASYSLLMVMVGKLVNMRPREFIHTTGDTHVYLNHLEAVSEQLSRTPLPSPKVIVGELTDDLRNLSIDCIQLIDYAHMPPIKAPVAV